MPTTDETYQPAQVAALLGVNVGTIRRWTTAHAAHLSPSAAPVAGGRRKLTPRDLEVLRAVAAMRDEGLTTAAINARLGGLTIAVPITTETPQEEQNGTQALALRDETMQPYLETLSSRLAALERSHEASRRAQRHWLVAFALGALSSAALILIILLLAWLTGAR